jgi:hypothetical protein
MSMLALPLILLEIGLDSLNEFIRSSDLPGELLGDSLVNIRPSVCDKVCPRNPQAVL